MIKLRYDVNPKYPAARVWCDDPAMENVTGLLFSDVQTPQMGATLVRILEDVVSGRRAIYEGSGNGFLVEADAKVSRVTPEYLSNVTTSVLPTADLIAVIKEWSAHLEKQASLRR